MNWPRRDSSTTAAYASESERNTVATIPERTTLDRRMARMKIARAKGTNTFDVIDGPVRSVEILHRSCDDHHPTHAWQISVSLVLPPDDDRSIGGCGNSVQALFESARRTYAASPEAKLPKVGGAEWAELQRAVSESGIVPR